MKNLKKFLLAVPFAIVMLCAGAFIGCNGKPAADFTSSKNIKSNVDNIVTNLTSNVYNKVGGTWAGNKLTMAEVNEILEADYNYYVDVGTLNAKFGEVTSIKLGDQTFESDQEVELSVGNNSFIVEKAFYVENNKLFVAAPVIAFETRANSKIVINNKEFSLGLNPFTDSKAVTGVAFKNESDGTVAQVEESAEYNVQVNAVTSWLKIEFEGAEENDIAITKKVKDGQLNSYGIVTMDDASTNPHIGFYPVTPSQVDGLEPFTFNYSAYVVGKGIVEVKLNISKVAE